jgi:hypothetical protein
MRQSPASKDIAEDNVGIHYHAMCSEDIKDLASAIVRREVHALVVAL